MVLKTTIVNIAPAHSLSRGPSRKCAVSLVRSGSDLSGTSVDDHEIFVGRPVAIT